MRKALIFMFISVSYLLQAQKSKENEIGFVGQYPVYASELKDMFFQGNLDDKKYDYDRFIPLFINFKLKVAEARNRKLDTLYFLRKSVEEFKDRLVEEQVINKKELRRLVDEALEREKNDVKISHIFVKVSPFAFDSDDKKARQKIEDAYQRLKKGENFEDVAQKYSEDRDTKGNAITNLDWFSVFQLPYDIENAAYKTPVGSFSQVVRSDKGYHIIMPTQMRESKGEVTLAHIFTAKTGNEDGDTLAKQKIETAYQLLKEGQSIQGVARFYSDDVQTAKASGFLGSFRAGELSPTIEKIAFDLNKKGAFSTIIESDKGWQIIYLVNKSTLDNKKEREEKLTKIVENNPRFIELQKDFLQKTIGKQKIKFDVDDKSFENIILSLGNMGYREGNWKTSDVVSWEDTLLTVGDQAFKVKEFYNNLLYSIRDVNKNDDLVKFVRELLNDFVYTKTMNYYVDYLAEKDIDLARKIKAFQEYAIVYRLEELEIWNKSREDEKGLEEFYQKNKRKYKHAKRMLVSISETEDSLLAEKARDLYLAGKTEQEVIAEINKGISVNIKVNEYAIPINADLPPEVEKKISISPVLRENSKFVVYNIKSFLEPKQKTKQEAYKELVEDYRQFLAENYVKDLRIKYDIVILDKEVKKLKKELSKKSI